MPDAIIFGFPPSTFVRSARMACIEKGVSHELRPLEWKTADHARLHPFLKMPAARFGDRLVFETLAIIAHVDRAFDGPPLLPSDPDAAVDALSWTSAAFDYIVRSFVHVHLGDATPNEEQINAMKAHAAILDARLSGREHLAGDALSIADVALAPIIAYARAQSDAARVVNAAPSLAAWADRVSARNSFSATAP